VPFDDSDGLNDVVADDLDLSLLPVGDGEVLIEGGAVGFFGSWLELADPEVDARLGELLEGSAGFSVELWFSGAALGSSEGDSIPHRILTFSVDARNHALMIGRNEDELHVRFRSDATDASGSEWSDSGRSGEPLVVVDRVFPTSGPGHLVLSWDPTPPETMRLFLDGDEVGNVEHDAPFDWHRGTLSTILALGDDPRDPRHFDDGEVHHFAMYDGPLTGSDVACLRAAGPR